MSLEFRHDAASGTGWYHLVTALERCLARRGFDGGLRKVNLNIVAGAPRKGYFNVLGVDGVYYDEPRLHANDPIRRAVQAHDMVIYQSRFSKAMAEAMLGVQARRDAVIHSGTALKPFRAMPAREPVVVACARWRPNKRPRAIAQAFVQAIEGRSLGDDAARLVMVGEVPAASMVAHPRVTYAGSLGRETLRRLLATAHLMVHICHVDSCPNAVVEALAMGVPVVCNNIGGTPELVGATGTIVPLDRPFDFRPIRSMQEVGDASVDVALLSRSLAAAYVSAKHAPRPDLSIERCAMRYVEEIRRAMG